MKIALLTFHTAANYGAALQAYALQKYLTDKGFDCEYINYVNESRRHEYDMMFHIMDCIKKGKLTSAVAYCLGSPFMTLRKRRFNRFYRNNLKATETVYQTSQEAVALNGKYDYFVVGSDQVWNPICNGDDAAFLLDFVKDGKRRVSYSSSFGIADVDAAHEEIYRRNLSQFKALAVRESIGQVIIQKLTGRKAELVLDPVLLLTAEQWRSIMPRQSKKERFIFSYTNQDSQTRDFFATGYPMDGLKHYVLSRYTKPEDFISRQVRVKYCMAPEEFVRVVNDAELVVTASFHCLALSIVLNKPFVAIMTGDKGKDERPMSLLRALGLEHRVLSSAMTASDVKAPIDYQEVNRRIEALKKSSTEYLLNTLK